MATTKIEWTRNTDGTKGKTWNPVTGCSKISPGCAHCYAERMAKRLAGRCGYPAEDPFRVTLHPDKLDEPLHWRKHQRIFTCSMGDLFHEDNPDWVIDEVFGVALACNILLDVPLHTFMMLTKRADRMFRYLTERTPAELLRAWAEASNWITVGDGDMCFDEYVFSATCHDWDENGTNSVGSEHRPWGYTSKLFPLPNVITMTTVENQDQADLRIPFLLKTPAVYRGVSVEPMLGPVDLSKWILPKCGHGPKAILGDHLCGACHLWTQGLRWVVCGGESGPGARPMHPDWARSLRDQCTAAGVPFLFKQHGEWYSGKEKIDYYGAPLNPERVHWIWPDGQHEQVGSFERMLGNDATLTMRVGKKAAGRLLDGQLWDQYPEVR